MFTSSVVRGLGLDIGKATNRDTAFLEPELGFLDGNLEAGMVVHLVALLFVRRIQWEVSLF
jgi:hypothetical protein